MLANEGLLRRAAGKGVFVPGSHIERDPEVLKGFTQTMPDRNVMPSIKVIKKMIRPAGAKYAIMFGFIRKMRYSISSGCAMAICIRKHRGIMNGPTGTKRFGTLSNSSAIWI